MELFLLSDYPLESTTRGATCSRCRAPRRNDEEKIIHTGIWIEYEGSLVFCESCVAEMGHAIGMIYESKAKATKADVSRSERREAKTRSLKNEILSAQKAINDLVEAFNLA